MQKSLLTFDERSFYLNGEPFRIFSGDVHYFRIHPTDWDRRLDLALDFGLNAVQVYVPWNAHEPEPGQYCFTGLFDLEGFLEKCAAHGLYVLFRPSPYMCSEWDLGGLPYWLLRDGIEFRTANEPFLSCVRRWYGELMPKIVPFLSTHGGPILACAVENEYGSYGNDRAYIGALADMIREFGVDVPLYATDGDLHRMIRSGDVEGGFHGMNFSCVPGAAAHAASASAKWVKAPFFSGELWCSGPLLWGERFKRSDPAVTAAGYEEALKLGCNVNLYMFSGGTNFGFLNGANYFRPGHARPGSPVRYTPRMTSYDEDSPVQEDGTVGEKYFLMRDAADRAKGIAPRPHLAPEHPVQVPEASLTESADFFDNLDALTVRTERSSYPMRFEELDQAYGLVVYTQELEPEEPAFAVRDPMDRALLFVNGSFAASFLRDHRVFSDTCTIRGGEVVVPDPASPKRFDVICENLGRVCFGREMRTERKGIAGITCGEMTLCGCENRSVPLRDLSGLRWKANEPATFIYRRPRFVRGTFSARSGVDAYLDTRGLGHGYAWVNGFHLGRFDCAGPQFTLYIPGGVLRGGENELILLDLSPTEYRDRAFFADGLILEGESEELK